MKRRATVVIVNGNDRYKVQKKMQLIAFLLVFLILITYLYIHRYYVNNEFSESATRLAMLNTNTVFSIDKIYLYSSAYATNNIDSRPIWNLNVNQYTDIALYINNRYSEGINYNNSIKSLTISDINFTKGKAGTPSLYYKDILNFANQSINEESKIGDLLDFKIVTDELDTSSASIYSNCQNPITLSYVNKNVKENYIIEDGSSTLKYDGNILRMTEVPMTSMKCTVSFKITLTNMYNHKYIANVYIDIPLEDQYTGESIYNGKIEKTLENSNLIKFFRIE